MADGAVPKWKLLWVRVQRASATRLGGALKLAIGVGILTYVLASLDRETLRLLAGTLGWSDAIMIALVALASHAFGALRFKLVCDPVVRLPLRQHLSQYFVAGYFGLFLPSSGGDVVRLLLLTRAGANASQAASLVFMERALGALSLLIVAACGALVAPVPSILRTALVLAAVAGSVGFLATSWIGPRLRTKRKWLDDALRAASEAVAVGRFAALLGLSCLYQLSAVAITVLAARALEIPLPVATIVALTPLVWFATLAPISVGGLGVREAAFVLLFSQVGLASEQSVLLSLGTYAGLVAVGLVGGAWFTWQRIRSARLILPVDRPKDVE